MRTRVYIIGRHQLYSAVVSEKNDHMFVINELLFSGKVCEFGFAKQLHVYAWDNIRTYIRGTCIICGTNIRDNLALTNK